MAWSTPSTTPSTREMAREMRPIFMETVILVAMTSVTYWFFSRRMLLPRLNFTRV